MFSAPSADCQTGDCGRTSARVGDVFRSDSQLADRGLCRDAVRGQGLDYLKKKVGGGFSASSADVRQALATASDLPVVRHLSAALGKHPSRLSGFSSECRERRARHDNVRQGSAATVLAPAVRHLSAALEKYPPVPGFGSECREQRACHKKAPRSGERGAVLLKRIRPASPSSFSWAWALRTSPSPPLCPRASRRS